GLQEARKSRSERLGPWQLPPWPERLEDGLAGVDDLMQATDFCPSLRSAYGTLRRSAVVGFR
ncbi:MAG: hypothetical protein WBW73_24350, partial [Rhodoplanes sp.]